MTLNQKQEHAKHLYVTTHLSRKNISDIVGVTEKTLRTWITKYDWDELKEANTITRKELLVDAYKQLRAINLKIEDIGGVPNKELSDAKGVIRKEIETLSSNPLHIYTETYAELLEYTKTHKPQFYKGVAEAMEAFVSKLLKDQNA